MDIESVVSRLLATGANLSTRLAVKKALRGIIEDDATIDLLYVAVRNRASRKELSRVPASKRALFLPACLRNSKKCAAVLSKEEGYKCKKCGSCVIGDIIERAESLGYKHVYIVPGGSMVHRILKKKAVNGEIRGAIGVACIPELVEAFDKLFVLGMPHRGVHLARDGCVDTLVEKEEVYRALELGLERDN